MTMKRIMSLHLKLNFFFFDLFFFDFLPLPSFCCVHTYSHSVVLLIVVNSSQCDVAVCVACIVTALENKAWYPV